MKFSWPFKESPLSSSTFQACVNLCLNPFQSEMEADEESVQISDLSTIGNLNGYKIPSCIAQLVTCLAKDACPTADPGVASLIPTQSHALV